MMNLLHFKTPLRSAIWGSLMFLNGCTQQPVTGTLAASQMSRPIFPQIETGLASVTSFDVYVDQDKIHLLIAGTTPEAPKSARVRYLHSDDGGQHWSLARDINVKVPVPIASRGNDIQLAVLDQQLLAVWQTSGEFPGMGPLVSVYSQDSGNTWVAGENPADNPNNDQAHADVTVDQQGRFHAVWLEDPEENGYQSLRYAQSKQPGKWDTPLTLDASTCSCCWNVLLTTPADELRVLYRDMEPRDMALLQSADHGKSWQRAGTVGVFNWKFDGCPHIGGALASANQSSDTLHSLVWTGAEQQQGLYYLRSDDHGKFWTAPHRLGSKALHGDITAANNQVIAVWDEMQPTGTRILATQSFDNGTTWLTPAELSLNDASATHPRIASTRFGYLALWTEKASKRSNQLGLAFFE